MTRMQVALTGALAAGLLALTTPALAQIVQGADGHYYKLVPLRHARRLAEAGRRGSGPGPSPSPQRLGLPPSPLLRTKKYEA